MHAKGISNEIKNKDFIEVSKLEEIAVQKRLTCQLREFEQHMSLFGICHI